MPSWLYDSGPNGLWVFILVTLIMGGAAAYMAGRAVAETWRPQWQLLVYALLLAATARFIHFAMFEEPLRTLKSFLVDAVILFGFAILGYRTARSNQMKTQYRWRT